MYPFGPVKTAAGISIHRLRKFSRLFSFQPQCALRGGGKPGQPALSAHCRCGQVTAQASVSLNLFVVTSLLTRPTSVESALCH